MLSAVLYKLSDPAIHSYTAEDLPKPVHQSMRVRHLLTLILLLASCAQNLDPRDPEGAYNLYINALWAKDAETVWERTAPTTHQYFQDQYETLVKMDETISKYLPPTDHKIAREQAGSILTSKVKDGKGLFLEVFRPDKLNLAEKHKVGAVVDQIRINEDETAAELTTLGGDVYYLTKGKGKDAEWYVMLVRSSAAVEGEMKWLTANESALNQTIEDLIDEERKEREAVIGELMKLAPPEEPAGEDEAAPTEDGSDGGQEEDSGNNGH